MRYLPAHGWVPTLLTVDPAQHVEDLDPALRSLVPTDAKIITVGALPIWLTAPFGLKGEIGLRGFFHLRAAIAREVAATRPEVVLFTGSPFYPMLLSRWVQQHLGVPVVLDFQDPWVSREGAARRRWTKGWLANKLAIALEPRALAGASWVTSVSERQNTDLANRYPSLDRIRMSAIPIGGDPTDFLSCETFSSSTMIDNNINSEFVIVYTGTVWNAAMHVLRQFLMGAQIASERLDGLAINMRLFFMGTTANPNYTEKFQVVSLMKELGINIRITEIPERRPFLQAVTAMSKAGVNLIIGSEEPHYTASKIYPILMANRPHLSILHRESSSHAILAEAGGGIAIAFENRQDLDALPARIADALVALATQPESVGAIDPLAYAPYTAQAVAGQFAEVFETVAVK